MYTELRVAALNLLLEFIIHTALYETESIVYISSNMIILTPAVIPINGVFSELLYRSNQDSEEVVTLTVQ